ncbi:DUF1702 family protein [Gynurincola endophyticus]|uniref:DUF1702 family protein n=1 Tax=Gynurincola endophyticus TaxID=2479004 RepID=UPI000F8F4E41|nr:DUF1702 family protein [Gynurincola endophyticus]
MVYLKLLKVSYSNALFEKRKFLDANQSYKNNFEQIGKDFLKAYNYSLGDKSLEKSASFIESTSVLYNRGFMYEGASMAHGFNIEMSLNRKLDCYSKLFSEWNDHIYMVHVGLGWAYSRIPLFSVESRIKKFDPVLRWLVIDGMGFHDTYFYTKKVLIEKKVSQKLKDPYATHVYYQGVGRCLWFVYSGNLSLLNKTIASFPLEYQTDLWAGVGLASVYAVGVDENILSAVKTLPQKFFPAFAQGVCFGSKARGRAKNITDLNANAAQLLISMDINEAASLTDQFYPVGEGESSALDRQWKQTIQNYFK